MFEASYAPINCKNKTYSILINNKEYTTEVNRIIMTNISNFYIFDIEETDLIDFEEIE